MPEQALVNRATVAAPKDYTVPGSQEFILAAVTASIDGTGAASPYQPCLQLVSDSGDVMWTAVSQLTVAAGASADVSWFPGLGGQGSGAVQALVGARILATSTQTVSSATNTDLVYDTVDFDTDGMTNLVGDNRKLTVNTPGLYIVVCSTVWTYNNAGRRLNGITKNSFYGSGGLLDAGATESAIWAHPVGGSGGQPASGNNCVGLFQCNAGDFFASGCNQDSGSSITCGGTVATTKNNSFLSAVLLAG